MATQWVLDSISNALAPTVSNAVSSAGGFAGGAVNAVGNSVSGVGESINRTIRTYGDGVKDYGNSIMDWTSASDTRGATAQNPLGLSGTKTAGKRTVTSPSMYYPPSTSKKTTGPPAKKAAPAPNKSNGAKKSLPPPKAGAKSTPAKAPVGKNGGGANPGAMRRSADQPKPVQKAVQKPISAASKPAPKPAASKQAAANKPDAHKTSTYMSSKAASNPIGISF